MVELDVWNDPDVARIFSKRITGELTALRALEIFLVRILRRYAYGV